MKATPFIPTIQIAQKIEEIVSNRSGMRKAFERRWYNNNFFDDGYHYRFVSRTTGRVVDLSTSSDTFIPYRAIPKASRQIRGVANLLVSNDYVPVVYPEKVMTTQYGNNKDAYFESMKKSKEIAKRTGQWIENKWKEMQIKEKVVQMVLLAAKHGVSYMEIWPDSVSNDIGAQVHDAFEIYVKGNLYSIYDSPSLIKSSSRAISQIKSNDMFDETQLEKLSPDNRYATSEIKEAYEMARYGTQRTDEPTIMLKEAFIKEYINDENIGKIKSDLGDEYGDRKKGDMVIRQVFEAAGVWLKDEYVSLPEYPFVDFRFEPGPIYQVPLIERFMPANKVLDSVMSRIERHIGTMAVGAWLKRRGEQYTISNLAGGQVIEYDATPPIQAQVAGLPAEVFGLIHELNSIIEEQGTTTAALGQTQPGVKSGVAIESLKASEYANLKIATNQLKDTIKRISERMLDYAAQYVTSPETVYRMDQGEPDYFDVIGQKGMDAYKKLAGNAGAIISVPNAIPIKKDYKVEIEVESGMGYTEEGKRGTMVQIIDYMGKMAQAGLITQEAVQVVLKRFLDIFQFGSTGEFMDALEAGMTPLTQDQINSIKVAVLEVIKDLQTAQTPQTGEPTPSQGVGGVEPVSGQDQTVLDAKTGVMSALSDLQQKNLQGGEVPIQ